MAQYPKKYKFYWKLFGNFPFLFDMENEQTQKYQNFISAQNFPEDPKNTRIRILYPKNTTSIPITLPWKRNPPGGNINYSIHMQKLCFLYDEKAVPASRSKV